MKRLLALGTALALGGCGGGGDAARPAANPPVRGAGGMAPVSCAEVPYDLIAPARPEVSAGGSVRVGVAVFRGRADYVIDTARVEVLRPGTRIAEQPGRPNPFAERHGDAAKRVERNAVAAGDTEFALVFDGKDERGATLPAGRYPVVYWIGSSGRPGSTCDGPPAARYGLVTTVDWRG